jgi:hypothetical protein
MLKSMEPLPQLIGGHGTMLQTQAPPSDVGILSRLIHPERADFSPEVARAILKFTFEPEDLGRMHELVVKNQDGALSQAEQLELESYRRVGRVLDMMHSKARLALKNVDQKAS